MQAAKKPNLEVDAGALDHRRAPAPVGGEVAESHPSPARSLQRDLASRWNQPATGEAERRWTPRSALLLSGGVSLLLWGAIAAAFAALR